MPALDPELDVAARALVEQGARFVVVGGFAVIANRFVRATENIDFLVPDDVENDRRCSQAWSHWAAGACGTRSRSPRPT
jgi:hypothetical protein